MRNEPLSYFVDKIKNNENFKFLRFGDGEFMCARGFFTHKEYIVTPEITADYRFMLKHLNPKHINGLQPLVLELPELAEWVPEHDWVNADVLHRASINGELFPFFEALQDQNVVLICDKYIAEVKKYFANCDYQIIVSEFDCYRDKNYVMSAIEEFSPRMTFISTASILTNYLIYHSRSDCTFIDAGSLFEPYVGRASRTYHKSRMTPEIIKKNLGRFYVRK